MPKTDDAWKILTQLFYQAKWNCGVTALGIDNNCASCRITAMTCAHGLITEIDPVWLTNEGLLRSARCVSI